MADVFEQYDIKKNPDINDRLRAEQYVKPWEGAPEGVEIPRSVYDIGQRLIAESPDDADTTVSKLNNAYYLSRQLGISLEEAYANHDMVAEEWFGRAQPAQTTTEAIANSYKAADIGTKIADLGFQLYTYKGNNPEIQKQIDALISQMPPEDTVKRSIPTKIIKAAAQFIPSQLESYRYGATEGAALAMTGAALASPAAATGLGALSIPTIALLGFQVGSAHGAMERTRQLELGGLYVDLLKYKDPASGAGINPEVAATYAAAYGGIAAVVEMTEVDELFKMIPGAKKAVQEAAGDYVSAAARSGVIQREFGKLVQKAGKDGAGRLKTIAKETFEETTQQAFEIAASEFAKQATERMDGTQMTPTTTAQIAEKIVETMVGTAMGMGLFQALPASVELFSNSAAAARNVAVSKAADAKTEKGVPGAAATADDLKLFEMRSRDPLPEGLYIQAKEEIEGEQYVLKIGERKAEDGKDTGKRHGFLRYSIDSDAETIKIEGFEKGAAPNINLALTKHLMAGYPGWNIEFDPKTPHQAALRDILTRDNPRGPEAGLQWYLTPAKKDQTIDTAYLRQRMTEAKPGWTEKEIDFNVAWIGTLARRMGMTGEQLADAVFEAPVFGNDGARIAQQGAFGAINMRRVGEQTRALIQLTGKSNASTWMHEASHAAIVFALENREKSPQIAQFLTEVETALGVQNGDWDAEFGGWTDEHRGALNFHEALAYGLEDYFATGKAPKPELQRLFEQIAKWIYDLYQNLKGARVKISPELQAYFDGLVSDPESPLYQYATREVPVRPDTMPGKPAGATRLAASASDNAVEWKDAADAEKGRLEAVAEQEREAQKGTNPPAASGEAMVKPDLYDKPGIDLYQGGTWDNKASEIQSELVSNNKRKPSIGETVKFIRFGDIVDKSMNHQNGSYEIGMSVYSINEKGAAEQTIRGEFSDREDSYIGFGDVVGFGSDGEPLVSNVRDLRKADTDDRDKAEYYGMGRSKWLAYLGYNAKGDKRIREPGSVFFQGERATAVDEIVDQVLQTLEGNGITYQVQTSRQSHSRYILADINGEKRKIRVSDHPQGNRSMVKGAADFDAVIGTDWARAFLNWLGWEIDQELFPREARPREAKTAERSLTMPRELYQIDPLYHGAKAGFLEFDHNYMGSGEGQQVYGWGTYLTENKSVARDMYAKRLGEALKISSSQGGVLLAQEVEERLKQELNTKYPEFRYDAPASEQSKILTPIITRLYEEAIEKAIIEDDVYETTKARTLQASYDAFKFQDPDTIRIYQGRFLYTVKVDTKGVVEQRNSGKIVLTTEMFKYGRASLFSHIGDGAMDRGEILEWAKDLYDGDEEIDRIDKQRLGDIINTVEIEVSNSKTIPGVAVEEIDDWLDKSGQFDYEEITSPELKAHVDAVTEVATKTLQDIIDDEDRNDLSRRAALIIQEYWGGPDGEPHLFLVPNDKTPKPETIDGRWIHWDKPITDKDWEDVFELVGVLREKEKEEVAKIFGDDYDKTGVQEQLEELDMALPQFETWKENIGSSPVGQDLYSTIAETIGMKQASLLLKAAGFDGVRYPVAFLTGGTGDKGFNYVVFDDKAVKITRRTLFQGEDIQADAQASQEGNVEDSGITMIKDIARQFSSWEEFAEDMEIPFNEDLRKLAGSEKMDEETKQRWYKELWESASRAASYGGNLDKWVDSLEADDYRGLTEFLAAIWDEILSGATFDFQPADMEEAEVIKERRERADRVRGEVAEVVKSGAIAVGAKDKKPSAKFLASVMGVIRKNPEAYGRIYGEIMDIPEMVQAAQTAEAEKYADIEDPKIRNSRLSISQKAAMAKVIRNDEIGRKIMRGDIVVDEDVKGYIDTLKTEGRTQSKRLGELQEEIRQDNKMLGNWERRWIDASERIAQSDEELKKINARIDKLITSNKGIPQALVDEKNSLTRIRETLERQREKAQRKVGNPAILQTTLAKIEEAARIKASRKGREVEVRAAKRLRAYKEKLARQITTAPGGTIAVTQARAINKIRAMVDPNFRSKRTQAEIDALRAELEANPALAREIGREWMNRATKKNLNEFTLAELEEMARVVSDLRKEGRAAFAIKEKNRKLTAANTQERIADIIMALPKSEAPGYKPDEDSLIGKMLGKVRDFDYAFTNMQRFARNMDGGKEAENYELLIYERDRAYRKEMVEIRRRVDRIMEAFKREGVDPETWFSETYTVMGPGRRDKVMRKSDLAAAELALRNEDSRQAAIYGNLFSHSEKRKMTEDDLFLEGVTRFESLRAAIDSALTDKDLRIIETFAADGDETGARLVETVGEVENRDMEIVENYFPINRQGVTGDPIDVQIAGDVLNRTPGTKRPPKNGFTKSRVNMSPKAQTPIKLDIITTWMQSIQNQEHYIANAAYGKKLNDVYLNNFMQEAIRAGFGDSGVNYVKEYIAEVKNPGELRNVSRWENSIKMFRGNLAAAYLGFKASSILKQVITSPWPAMAYSGPRLLAETMKCMTNPVKYVLAAEELSIVLKNRTADLIFEAVKNGHPTTAAGRKIQKINEFGMKGLEIADRVSVAIGWRSIFEKEMTQNGGNIEKAIEKADDITLKTQPSARGVDLAPIYRTGGEPLKLLLQFTSAMNVIWQNIRHDIPNAIREKHYANAVGIMVSYIIAGTLLNLVTDGLGDDDDPEKKAKLLAFFALTQGTEAIPLIGQDVTRFVRTAITGETGYDFPDTALPGADYVFDGLTTIAKDPENWERGLQKFAEGSGLIAGAPVSGTKELMRVFGGDFGALIARPREKN